ncbi:uncharacterized protein LOC133815131 [Humulus lupulus]|uniref:uncharacterized protein LOC133815131 n=1 Tax=Humulus lupulus TaxID=3486 RepID=UPI002B4013AE|nr:uncharacterized protein LOC133815131 [Humulus lupulus]
MDLRQREAIATLEEAIQLARGQPAPTSQPNQPPSVPPQQGPNLSHPPQPASPQRPEQPPVAQQDIPFQDPEYKPPSRVGQDNPQRPRQNRAGQPPLSPRHQTAVESNPPSRGKRPSTNRRHAEPGSTVRVPPRHNNAWEPTDRRRTPPGVREVRVRGGNSAISRSRHS